MAHMFSWIHDDDENDYDYMNEYEDYDYNDYNDYYYYDYYDGQLKIRNRTGKPAVEEKKKSEIP